MTLAPAIYPGAPAYRAHFAPRGMYGSMYGMHRTTIYLPDDLRDQLARTARARGWSEAETVRAALRAFVTDLIPPPPRFPLFASGDPTLAEHVDDALAGFGET